MGRGETAGDLDLVPAEVHSHTSGASGGGGGGLGGIGGDGDGDGGDGGSDDNGVRNVIEIDPSLDGPAPPPVTREALSYKIAS